MLIYYYTIFQNPFILGENDLMCIALPFTYFEDA